MNNIDSFDEAARRLPEFALDDEARQRQRALIAGLTDNEEPIGASIPDLPPTRTRHRRFAVVGVATAAACAIGVSVAAASGAFDGQPTNSVMAYCYATADLRADNSNRMGISSFELNGIDTDTLDKAVILCGSMWEAGQLRSTEPFIVGLQNLPQEPDPQPIPSLVECILPDGVLAVLPGVDETACTTVGLEPRTP